MDIVVRAAVAFGFILLLTRVLGKRELSTLEPFDLILLAVLTVAASYASFRFRRLRPVLEGEPIILVHDGEPIDRNLRGERLTLDELAAEARMQQIGSLGEAKWAILETNGKISFLR